MPVVALPDVLKAVVEYLKAVPEVAAIVSTAAGWQTGSGARVSGAYNQAWRLPSQAVVIRRAGGPGTDYVGWHTTRLDVWCYGANALEAVTLWRTVHPALCRAPGSGETVWTSVGCRVASVTQEGDPIPTDDQDVTGVALVTPYLVRYLEVPVS